MRSNSILTKRVNTPSLPETLSILALIIGDSVTATIPEITTAAASVKANSRNSIPVNPPWNPIGAYTTAKVIVIAMMGPNNSRAPINADWILECPSRICLCTFSTTTIASSTTNPTDNTIASSVNKLSENPIKYMQMVAPINETGMATSGTMAVRIEPIKTKTTMPTIAIVSMSVFEISFSASRMNFVASNASCMSIWSGKVGRSFSMAS